MFCFRYNWVWQSWLSEINSVLLFLIHQYGSLRTCLIIFNMFKCQHATFCGFVSTYGSLRTRWICDTIMFLLIKNVAIKLGTFQGFFTSFFKQISMYLIIGYWVLVRFVGCLYCFLQHQNPNRTSNYFYRKSSAVVEVTHTLSGLWFLQISSQLLSRYSKLGVYRSILFDRTSILFVEQAENRSSTPYLGALHTFACQMQDVVWSDQALLDLDDSNAWDLRL